MPLWLDRKEKYYHSENNILGGGEAGSEQKERK